MLEFNWEELNYPESPEVGLSDDAHGGPGARVCPDEGHIGVESSLDYIVMGEDEFTFLEFCKNVLSGLPVENVKGLAYRKKEPILNPPRGARGLIQ